MKKNRRRVENKLRNKIVESYKVLIDLDAVDKEIFKRKYTKWQGYIEAKFEDKKITEEEQIRLEKLNENLADQCDRFFLGGWCGMFEREYRKCI